MPDSLALFTSTDQPPLGGPLVGFIRVSTVRQGELGESRDQQIIAINMFAQRSGAQLLGIYGDVATGVGARAHELNPELQDAVGLARQAGGVLVVTTVSRLGRNRAVIDWLRKMEVDVWSLDHGCLLSSSQLSRAIIQAENAAATRKKQIREALAEAKSRGARLGNRANLKIAQRNGTKATITKSQALTEEIAYRLRKHDPEMRMRAVDIADLLNELGILTGQNNTWTNDTVQRHLRKARRLISEL